MRPVGRAIFSPARQDAAPPEAPPHLFPDFRATSGGAASSRAHSLSSRPRSGRTASRLSSLVSRLWRARQGTPTASCHLSLFTFHCASAVRQRAPPGYPLYDTPCPPSASGRPARRTRRTKDRDRTWAFRDDAGGRRGARRNGVTPRHATFSRLPSPSVSAKVGSAKALRGANPAASRRTIDLHTRKSNRS